GVCRHGRDGSRGDTCDRRTRTWKRSWTRAWRPPSANKKPAGKIFRPGSRVPGLLAICLTWLQAGRLKLPRDKRRLTRPEPFRQAALPIDTNLDHPCPEGALPDGRGPSI